MGFACVYTVHIPDEVEHPFRLKMNTHSGRS
jgi:hypothetical protein